jgi:hypothetical protein
VTAHRQTPQNYGKVPCAADENGKTPEPHIQRQGGAEPGPRGNAVRTRAPAARHEAVAEGPTDDPAAGGGGEGGGGGEDAVVGVLVLHLLLFFLGLGARQAFFGRPGRDGEGRIRGARVPAARLPGDGRGGVRRRVQGQRAVAAEAVGSRRAGLGLGVGVARAALGRAHRRRLPHLRGGGGRRRIARAALRSLPLRRLVIFCFPPSPFWYSGTDSMNWMGFTENFARFELISMNGLEEIRNVVAYAFFSGVL